MNDKIILVHSIYVGNTSRQEVIEAVSNYQHALNRHEKDKNITHYVVSITEGNSKIECIYPVMISDKEAMEKMEDNLKRFNEALESQLKVMEE